MIHLSIAMEMELGVTKKVKRICKFTVTNG